MSKTTISRLKLMKTTAKDIQPRIRCSICGCDQYTKYGNTSSGQWAFVFSAGHVWWFLGQQWSIRTPFPYREDDYYHPKNYGYTNGVYCRLGDTQQRFPPHVR